MKGEEKERFSAEIQILKCRALFLKEIGGPLMSEAESERCRVSRILSAIFIVEVRNCVRNEERNCSLMNDLVAEAMLPWRTGF